ncbi:MAG TPA: M48 family metallopeptidase [Burkholderiales bacterium]|nr:M48 family metallopeptidase [Burkholderiales bacterium]
MNFFEHQQLARRNTRVMVLLFALSVVAIVVAVNLVVATIYVLAADDPLQTFAGVPRSVHLGAAFVTFVIIAVVSLVNIVGLAGGGAKVAKMMGARLVAANSQDRLERRLLNIVEEMAIASGVRLPQAYVMDGEKGINAFAAGWSVSGAVVCVTRGTLESLTRDELQGVIGHEFSHILNGDMGLNIRMIGVLAGIVAIGSIGGFVMRNAFEADDIRAAVPIFLIGLAIFIVGYTGLFFARLIKASVSRQREFLADASSVQFTRNPDGIAGALDQIRASGAGTLISGRYAEEMSHMFFGQSVKMRLAGLFQTHPPLEDRIRRVHPRFQLTPYRQARSLEAEGPAAAAGFAGATVSPAGRRSDDRGNAWGRSAGESAQLVGTLGADKLTYAERLLASIPASLRDRVREPGGAAGVVVALLLAPKDEVMRAQLQALAAAGLAALAQEAQAAEFHTRSLAAAYRLPLLDLGLPALKQATPQMKKELLAGLEAVIYADRRVSLDELIVLTLVREQMQPKVKPPPQTKKIAELAGEAATLLALVAQAGTRSDATGQRAAALEVALRAGAATIGIEFAAASAVTLDLPKVQSALEALRALAPLQKAILVKGLFATVTADGTIRVVEAEVMRAIAAVLDCPLPPLLTEIDPAALAT